MKRSTLLLLASLTACDGGRVKYETCAPPAPIDFGQVEVGQAAVLQPAEGERFLAAVGLADVSVADGGLQFAPTVGGPVAGAALVQPRASCAPVSVEVTGEGVDRRPQGGGGPPEMGVPDAAVPLDMPDAGVEGLQFGGVELGKSGQLGITLKNTSTRPVRVTGIHLEGVGFVLLPGALVIPAATVGPDGKVVPGELSIPIGFIPPGLGVYQGSVRISTDDGQPDRVVPLEGLGLAPGTMPPLRESDCLRLSTDLLAFGRQLPHACGAAPQHVDVRNVCASPVLLQSVRPLDSLFLPEFDDVTLPATLVSGATTRLTIWQRPIDVHGQDHHLEFEVVQSGTRAATKLILRGGERGPERKTDTFLSRMSERRILLLVDTSSAMQPLRGKLAQELDTLGASAARRPGLAWLGVASMNEGPGLGKLVSLEDGGVNFQPEGLLEGPELRRVLDGLPVDSPGAPRCLEAAVAALRGGGPGSRLLDDRSGLSILCWSNQPEGSPRPVSDYLRALRELKRDDRWSLSATTPLSPGCALPGEADDGRLAAATSGRLLDLCGSWLVPAPTSDVVTARYPLSTTPDLSLGPMQVTVEGVVQPRHDSVGRELWRFDAAANAVELQVPAASAGLLWVQVQYAPTCAADGAAPR